MLYILVEQITRDEITCETKHILRGYKEEDRNAAYTRHLKSTVQRSMTHFILRAKQE